MKIINIKDNVSLDDFLKEKETPSLLRAYSDSCGHCKAMNNEWKKLKAKLSNLHKEDNFNLVDVRNDYVNELPNEISSKIIGFPTIMATKDGNMIKSFDDDREEAKMYDFCKKYLLDSNTNLESLNSYIGGKKVKKINASKGQLLWEGCTLS